jgi:hypothetical protein
MNIASCSRCGGLFAMALNGEDVCPSCLKKSEETYRKIFNYFVSKPAATAEEIAKDTGIEVKEIYRFVREKRLQLVKTDTGKNCEKCGRAIFGGKLSGKLCDKCRLLGASDSHKGTEQQQPSGTQNKSKLGSGPKSLKDGKKSKKH